MIKKYSYPECTIEVEYVPGLTYVGALYDHCGISRVKISNISDIGWNTITVSITGSFYTAKCEGCSGGSGHQVRLPSLYRIVLM